MAYKRPVREQPLGGRVEYLHPLNDLVPCGLEPNHTPSILVKHSENIVPMFVRGPLGGRSYVNPRGISLDAVELYRAARESSSTLLPLVDLCQLDHQLGLHLSRGWKGFHGPEIWFITVQGLSFF